MTNENLDTTSFLQWLLGPGWYDAALLQTVVLAVLLPLAGLGVVWVISRLRRRIGPVGPRAGAAVTITIGALTLLGVLFSGLWFAKLRVSSNETTTRDLIASMARPFNHGLSWLLGQEWYKGVAYHWLLLLACLTAAIFMISWLVATLSRGPGVATSRSGQVLVESLLDLLRTSPRRVWALACLAVRESLRRRVIVVFAVFVIVVLFAGWYLDPGSAHPAQLYIQFVLTTTFYLTLVLALVLSSLSIPGDIKERTLHTVVTKPVRKTEIVLGRLLGFTLVGTVLLAAMGAISYAFTYRGLSHTHSLTAGDLHKEALPGKNEPLLRGQTGRGHGHQHEVIIDPSRVITVERKQDHTHEVTVDGTGDSAVYTLGPPKDLLVARVPVYGKLRFISREGREVEKGVNVGDEWTYRSFIAGQTAAAAIWSFEDMTEDRFPEETFPDGLPVEMTLEVFRTWKGEERDIESGILGSLWVRNSRTGRKVVVSNFLAKKFATDVHLIPRTIVTKDKGKSETLNLFGHERQDGSWEEGLVSQDGRLEVGVQCLRPGQFFGMAKPDLYFRAGDNWFFANFIKGYLGIWLQMVVVLALGVMFSTFLSGPIALIATLGAVIAGLFSGYMGELAMGQVVGGGPFEAFIRIFTQQNLISEMEPGLQTNAAQMGDKVMQAFLWVLSSLLPGLRSFDYADYVASGFDVSRTLLLKCLFQAMAFIAPVTVIGYLCLKMREVAK